MRKGKITAKFQSLKRVVIEDKNGFMSPGKFRAVRETGPSNILSRLIPSPSIQVYWPHLSAKTR